MSGFQIINSYSSVPDTARGCVLAIGNFDGVHRGHQAVLQMTRDIADGLGAKAGVMTFEPHPRSVFKSGEPLFRLTTAEQKLKLFSAFGLDLAVVLPFDKDLYSKPGRAFIDDVLVRGLGVRHVVSGYDFFFGKGRDGGPDLLREEGKRLGFGVTIAEAQGEAGEVFSSSRVRDALAAGDVRRAAEILGYWWCVEGVVRKGAGKGDGMGFPTANIHLMPGQNLRHGIYAVRIRVAGNIYDGAAYLGTRPTFDDGEPVLEIFVFGFNGQVYGQSVTVAFVKHIRDDARFDDVAQLKAQMTLDCEACETALSEVAKYDPLANSPLKDVLLSG